MKKLLLLLTVLVLCGCDVWVTLDEIAKEQAQTQQREQSTLNKVVKEADVIHIMHAVGVVNMSTNMAASMSVTYLLLADSTVLVVNKKGVSLPYTPEMAKLIMLKELELANQKK